MKARYLALLAMAPFAFVDLRAQTATGNSIPDQPPPVPPSMPATPYPYYSYPYGYDYDLNVSSTRLAGAVTFPYAFNFKAVGVSGELGALAQRSFFGGEVSYYGGNNQGYEVFDNSGTLIGHFRSAQDITTLEFAYRYFIPVLATRSWFPTTLYVGASGGVGFVNYTNDGSYFGFHNDDSGDPAGELLGGFQFNVARGVDFRLGYRYVALGNVWQFDHRSDMESSVLEAGLAFRF